MKKLNIFQLLGLQRKENALAAINEQMKEQLTEIITLKHIRKEQMKTISELRSENFHLKNLIRDMKGL